MRLDVKDPLWDGFDSSYAGLDDFLWGNGYV